MLSRRLPVLLLGLMPTLGGCQGPDISPELDAYQQLVDDTNLLRCDCPQDLGFDTKAECDQAIGYVTTAERQCLEDAVDGEEADAQDYLGCANAALQNYEQCLAANVNCEAGANDACASVYSSTVAQCTQLPSDIRAVFLACTA
jgi:hypothetical protein